MRFLLSLSLNHQLDQQQRLILLQNHLVLLVYLKLVEMWGEQVGNLTQLGGLDTGAQVSMNLTDREKCKNMFEALVGRPMHVDQIYHNIYNQTNL